MTNFIYFEYPQRYYLSWSQPESCHRRR